jgi:hypothetical protein
VSEGKNEAIAESIRTSLPPTLVIIAVNNKKNIPDKIFPQLISELKCADPCML